MRQSITSSSPAAVVLEPQTGIRPRGVDYHVVAYVVPAGQPPSTASDLRGRLIEKLPDFMVPSAFVFLDTLPRLPGGKVDRLALPRLGPERPNLN